LAKGLDVIQPDQVWIYRDHNKYFEEEESMSYKVYLYNIPKVSEDGKQSIPVPDSQMKEFNVADDAKMFAAEHKNNFDRLVLMQDDDEGQKIVIRYVDGL
jgi:hypothetical protein